MAGAWFMALRSGAEENSSDIFPQTRKRDHRGRGEQFRFGPAPVDHGRDRPETPPQGRVCSFFGQSDCSSSSHQCTEEMADTRLILLTRKRNTRAPGGGFL